MRSPAEMPCASQISCGDSRSGVARPRHSTQAVLPRTSSTPAYSLPSPLNNTTSAPCFKRKAPSAWRDTASDRETRAPKARAAST